MADCQTLLVRFQEPVLFIQINRPQANNTINALLIEEFHQVIDEYEKQMTILVIEGLKDVFCFGGDFQGIHDQITAGNEGIDDPERLYDLWLRLAVGPYITISHVRGKANAGGVGFVAASDIVIADETALFSLSELLFGLYPACVLPFLISKMGYQKSHYMTLMTKPVTVQQAHTWGLVDAFHENSEGLLRQHMMRLKNLPKDGITRYKKFMGEMKDMLFIHKNKSVAANKEIFADAQNLDRIFKFVEKGQYPWEN